MTETTEIRVRPVTRHQITCWAPSGIRTIGEYANAVLADEAARGLKALYPEAQLVNSEGEVSRPMTTKYVLVQVGHHEVDSLVYHADAEDLVKRQAELAVQHPGIEFRVFGAPSATLPAPPNLHTAYPARHGIGDKVLRAAVPAILDNPEMPEEIAQVHAVHFYPGKVRYDLTFPSGRRMECVDSCDVKPLVAEVEIGGI